MSELIARACTAAFRWLWDNVKIRRTDGIPSHGSHPPPHFRYTINDHGWYTHTPQGIVYLLVTVRLPQPVQQPLGRLHGNAGHRLFVRDHGKLS